MVQFASPQQLDLARERLGPLHFLDFSHLDLVTAHRCLGEAVGGQTRQILGRKLARLDEKKYAEKIRFSRRCHAAMVDRLSSGVLARPLQTALDEYLACLIAWSEGAQLALAAPGHPAGLTVDGRPVSALDLALLLQDENQGCQTGVYRDRDGSVFLWHTEEDVEPEPGHRFDRLRVVSFGVGGAGPVHAFIYPDLLPGPAFCWGTGFIQAVDSLPVKARPDGLLANTASWLTMRLAGTVEPQTVFAALAPFADGYALTMAWTQGTSPGAVAVEFAGRHVETRRLSDRAGDYLFQVNIFSNPGSPIALAHELARPETRQNMEGRLARTARALNRIHLAPAAFDGLRYLLACRLGGDYAYANDDVKATVIGRVSAGGVEIRLAEGPARRPEPKATF